MKRLLYRDVQAGDLLDLFLLSAITSLLGVRFYLHLTGYPQIGGASLHIAHMLWGGLLMLIGLVLSLTFLGRRTRWVTALVGGAGFGIFIDEIGKFITHDNNYFFRPAVGIIYAIFVILYLLFNFLGRKQRLSSSEYQMNALAQLEEAVALDFDVKERRELVHLLNKADKRSEVTVAIRKLVEHLSTSKQPKPGRLHRLRKSADEAYELFWQQRNSNLLVRLVSVLQVLILIVGVVVLLMSNYGDLRFLLSGPDDGSRLFIDGWIVSALVAAGFAIYGAWQLRFSRLDAFESFRRSTLVNLFLTQFFIFAHDQFKALPGFALNLVIMLLITYVLRQERRLSGKDIKV